MALVEECIVVAREAAAAIARVARNGIEVSSKGAAGPVTNADHASNRILHESLLKLHRGGWLSEESADDPSRLHERSCWVVDPLDGTREFARGIQEYVVAIGLVEDGVPTLAVIANPATDEVYWAVRGGGAYHEGKRLAVAESNVLLASRSEAGHGEFAPFRAEWECRPIGSIQLKLALVAAGQAGGTLSRGPKHEWDVCAGALLINEAGGKTTDLFGQAFQFNQEFPKVKGIVAGEPGTHTRLLDACRLLPLNNRMREFPDLLSGR